jgi:hypothetical protein
MKVNKPIFEHWKKNEIIRPVSFGFYCMLIALAFVVFVSVLISPVSAGVVNAYSVNQYSVQAEPGNVIYQIIIDPVPIGTNQTHVLNYNGATFGLSIGSATSYGIFHNFDISLTYPNGTTVTQHTSDSGTLGNNYKTTIQPVFFQAESLTLGAITVDLNVGLTPLSVGFSAPPVGYNPSSAIPFSSASGNLGASTNVFVWEMSQTDFTNNVVKYNPVYGIGNLGATVFQWTWSEVLGFINMIPFFGPLFISLLDMVQTVTGGIWYWLTFVILNIPAIIAGGEIIIIMWAFLEQKKPQPAKTITLIYQHNVTAVMGFLTGINLIWRWGRDLLDIVVKAIQAIKPI